MLLKRTVSPSAALPAGVPTLVTVAHGAAGITASNPSSTAPTFTAASISADKMTVAELRELQQSGARVIPLDVWPRARALIGGWQALEDGGFSLRPHG